MLIFNKLSNLEKILSSLSDHEVIKKTPYGAPIILGEWTVDGQDEDDEPISTSNINPETKHKERRLSLLNEGT